MQNDIVKPPQSNNPANTSQPTSQDVVQPSVGPAVEQQQAQSTDQSSPNFDFAAPAATKKRSAPKGVMAVAALICAGLVGLSLYLTIGQSKELDKLAKTPSSEQATDTKPTADVQGAITEADTLPDVEGDPSADLTDQSLGL
jgi:hypothetical protein